MKKNQLFRLLFTMTLLTACSQKETTEEVYNHTPMITTETIEITTEKNEQVNIQLYYGNATADGLVTEEVTINELTPENILYELRKKNIISVDTKVRGFQIVEKEREKIVDLNLSKEFREYVGMMGTAGEYIVLAGLTNTFLNAYSGTSLVLNINGMPLETGHNIYDKPLTVFPLNNSAIEMDYQLKEEKIEDDINHITYPQFTDMEDEVFMKKWNTVIKEIASGKFREQGMQSYKVEYEIMTQDVEMVSILFRGECMYENAAYPYRFARTITINIKENKEMRLSEYSDISKIIKTIQEKKYEIFSDISKEELDEYLQNECLGELPILLFDYDYDMDNKGLIPTGYSYIKNNKPVLVMNVLHTLGDYIEIHLEEVS